MKRPGPALFFAASTLLASVVLTGCGGFAGVAIPDTTSAPVTQPSVAGALTGSVYGGHAPIVGAHVYVLEPGTSGYGSQATSDLYAAATGNGSAVTLNTADPGIPTSWYYVTTDTSGGFQLTGDYSCHPGNPVYLYAYGGTPSFPASSLGTTNTFNIGGPNNTAGPETVTYVSGDDVTGLTLVNGGTGYYISNGLLSGTAPLTFTGGGGSGAAGTATITNGVVTAVSLTSAGTGYTSAPTIGVNAFLHLGTNANITATVDTNLVNDVQFTVSSTTAAGVSNPPENFYVGETLQFTSPTNSIPFVSTSGTVIATGLTTNTFDVQVTGFSGEITSGSKTTSNAVPAGADVIGAPAYNVGIVNLAVLGVCPSSGNFSTGGTVTLASGAQTPFTALSYVYMNEISTVAAAYAFDGFTAPTATHNNATYIGSTSTNLIGIQNAALNAGLLYDIQGSSLSTVYAGEGHIARATTPGGNGTVPQALLDTLGNILAACVDSNNTITTPTATGTGVSPQCATLFQTATQNGIPYPNSNYGTLPQDTAQAAINIARHPAGTTSSGSTQAAWVSTLNSLPTGNVPFTPNLTSVGQTPNDFSVGINFPSTYNTSFNKPEGLAIDASGDVWVNDPGSNYVTKISPTGLIGLTYHSSYTPGYVSIDPSGDVWWGPHSFQGGSVTGNVSEISNTGTVLSTTNYASIINSGYAYTTAIDGSGNIYIPNYPQNANYTYTIEELYPTTGGTVTGTSGTVEQNFTAAATTCFGTTSRPDHIALDANTGGSNLWVISEANPTICAFNVATGAPLAGYPKTVPNFGGNTPEPVQLGIDSAQNIWFTAEVTNRMYKLTQSSGTLTDVTAGTTVTLNNPFSATLDGGGNVWVTNRNSNSVSEFTNAGVAVTQTVNYEGGNLNTPLNAAVDLSGDLWIANYGGASVTELLGIALPVVQPLSVAQGANKLGTEP